MDFLIRLFLHAYFKRKLNQSELQNYTCTLTQRIRAHYDKLIHDVLYLCKINDIANCIALFTLSNFKVIQKNMKETAFHPRVLQLNLDNINRLPHSKYLLNSNDLLYNYASVVQSSCTTINDISRSIVSPNTGGQKFFQRVCITPHSSAALYAPGEYTCMVLQQKLESCFFEEALSGDLIPKLQAEDSLRLQVFVSSK